MQISIIETNETFKKLQAIWETLSVQQKDVNIFLTFEWVYTWWRHFGKAYRLFIIMVEEGSDVIGILPLMKVNRAGFRSLEFIGSDLSDYEGMLLAPSREKEVIGHVADFLTVQKGWDIWRIRRIPEQFVIASTFISYYNQEKFSLLKGMHTHRQRVSYIDTSVSQHIYRKRLKAKFLSDTRRREKKLSDQGDVAFLQLSDDDLNAEEMLNDIRRFHIKRRKEKQTQSFFADHAVFDFFCDISKIFSQKGWLDLSLLKCGTDKIAFHFGFLHRNVFHYYLPVFDDMYKPYAVSRLLLKRLLDKCFQSDCLKCDFMLGDEPYKRDWQPDQVSLRFFHLSPNTFRGHMAFLLFDRLLPWFKKKTGKAW